MEKSTPIGIGLGLFLIYGSIFMGDGWSIFFDLQSLVIVVGGTAAALLVTFSLIDLKAAGPGFKSFMSFEPPSLQEYMEMFTEFSRVARREGLLALDRRLGEVEDEFVRYGLEMAVDGIDEAEIDELMRVRMREDAHENQLTGKLFTNAGTYAPAFGMVGTLIGLIQMMQNLADPAQIGAGMATALVTTFYGALLANLVFLPTATKVKAQGTLTTKGRNMVRLGVLAIVRGESPSMIEKRLAPFVAENDDEKAAEPTPLAKAA